MLGFGAALLSVGSLNAQPQRPQAPPSPEEFFKKADTNEDGLISMEEADERLKKDFKRLDANKDGKLSLEELRQGKKAPRARQANRAERPSPDQIFADLDSNKDGKISKEEAKGPLKEHFAKVDTDENGFISKEELEKAPRPQNNRRGGRRQ